MPTRRAILAALAAAACARPRGPADTGEAAGSDLPLPVGDDTPLDPITPTEAFYRVSYSGWSPDEAWLAAWTLTLADDEGQTRVLTLAELQALGGELQERTLACIGGGSAATIGNATWTALRLDALFAAVGFAPAERLKWVRIRGGDGFITDVPRADLDRGLALAWAMNGEPLPAAHGAPVRALVPGRFGMKNPKWVTRIDLAEVETPGLWEQRGWSSTAEYRIQSWFVTPGYGSRVGTAGIWAKGVAFAGERPIGRVEVSVDNGATWADAQLTYQGGPGVWSQWRFRWLPEGPGTYALRVRATTLDGEVQAHLEDYDEDLDGLEAWDLAEVEVVEATDTGA